MLNIYEQVDRNKTKSTLVVILFIGFILTALYTMLIAYNLDGSMVLLAMVLTVFGSLSSYYYSDRIILSLSNARPAVREEFFDFYTVAENLSMAAQLPKPKLYVIEDSALNAFAAGRDPHTAVIVATTGILERLDRTELEGVIAHELAHIRNYDIRLMAVVAVLVGGITLVADWMLRLNWHGRRDDNAKGNGIVYFLGFLSLLISPIIAQIIKLAISRSREYLADASAAALTRYPEGLARALEKISLDTEPLEAANKATAHLYIANPLKNHRDAIGWFAQMFSTHPPIEARITALRNMR